MSRLSMRVDQDLQSYGVVVRTFGEAVRPTAADIVHMSRAYAFQFGMPDPFPARPRKRKRRRQSLGSCPGPGFIYDLDLEKWVVDDGTAIDGDAPLPIAARRPPTETARQLADVGVVSKTFGPTPAELEAARRKEREELAALLPAIEEMDSAVLFGGEPSQKC